MRKEELEDFTAIKLVAPDKNAGIKIHESGNNREFGFNFNVSAVAPEKWVDLLYDNWKCSSSNKIAKITAGGLFARIKVIIVTCIPENLGEVFLNLKEIINSTNIEYVEFIRNEKIERERAEKQKAEEELRVKILINETLNKLDYA